MISKRSLIVSLLTIVLFNNHCYAEGQAGISDIINFTNSIFVVVRILVFTFVGGMILRFILKKFKPEISNRNVIAFTASFLLTLLIMVIIENK